MICMNINFENIIRKNLPKTIMQPRRAMIYVGFQCHQKCGFCYYKHKCSDEMFDVEYIKKQIDFEYEYGIRDFEITGGEPSEHMQLRQICKYIKDKDCNSKIAIITNGGLWRSDIWDLIDEVLVSYHLGRSLEYDKNMFPLGCTYDKVKKTIEKARSFGKIVRTNTVVATFNIDVFDDLINDLISFSPDIVNFLPINLFDQATDMNKYIDYGKLRNCITHSIDLLNEKLPNSLVFVRYMPFCKMEGYEKHIVGNLQHIYDWFDWNRELDGIVVLDMINDKDKSLKELGSYGCKSIQKALNIRKNFYEKSSKCLTCKYQVICDGVEKTKNHELTTYIEPCHGKIQTNIIEYIKDQTYHLYKSKYML